MKLRSVRFREPVLSPAGKPVTYLSGSLTLDRLWVRTDAGTCYPLAVVQSFEPEPEPTRACVVCGATMPAKSRGTTCSRSCRATLREQRKRKDVSRETKRQT